MLAVIFWCLYSCASYIYSYIYRIFVFFCFFFILFFSILFIKGNPYFFEILFDISGFIGGTAFPFSFLLHYFLGSPYLTLFIRSHFNSDAVLGILNYRSSEKSNNSIYKMTRTIFLSLKACLFAIIALKKFIFCY